MSQKAQQHTTAADSIQGYPDDKDDNDRDDNYSLERSNRRNLELPPSPSWTIPPGLASLPPLYHEENDAFDLDIPKSPPLTLSADRFTTLPPTILIRIMDLLDFGTLIQLIRLNRSMQAIFALDQALNHVDLSTLHKKVTDDSFASLMAVMRRRRLRSLSLQQCFHLTDSGFRSLLVDNVPLQSPLATPTFLQHFEKLDLNSCWLLTDHSLQLLGERCPHLTHLDLSNCRKITNDGMYRFLVAKHGSSNGLAWLSVSYCKNLTDVTMQHLADYCRHSLTYLNLQRCTKITDAGFMGWTATSFPRLRELLLVDCSFLTDRAIQSLTEAAPGLERLSLSFCCSLSDSAMYHLGHLDHLVHVDVSFCGAAVSDVSLPLLGPRIKRLNIRGCVRVTGQGLLRFLHACPLITLNISQCPSIPPHARQHILDLALVQHLIV
jgi:F-box/leucine-rich repeat protein 7